MEEFEDDPDARLFRSNVNLGVAEFDEQVFEGRRMMEQLAMGGFVIGWEIKKVLKAGGS